MNPKRVCVSSCQYFTSSDSTSHDLCPARVKLHQSLWAYFGHDCFRPGQLQATLPVMHGCDVVVKMPTGGGKTLCMFLPPLATSDTAMGLVISPLVALMEQQVSQLEKVGVSAIRVCDKSQCQEVAAGKYRFVFMAPESVQVKEWRSVLSCIVLKERLVLVSVDEAHCITEWGQDFRKAFKLIGGLRALVDAPFMALTASAPACVMSEIIESLDLNDPHVVSCDLNRPNIFFSAGCELSLTRDFSSLVTALKGRTASEIPKTIVYTQTKDSACQVYGLLSAATNRKSVGLYHADITRSNKVLTHQQFSATNSSMRCLVATIAYGLGIDIPDIDVVVVYGLPDTLTQLYQLFGRAGRSGENARAHLFYPQSKKEYKDASLRGYVESKEKCRRHLLLHGMGGSYSGRAQICCDVCTPDALDSRLDVLRPGPCVRPKHCRPIRHVSDELQEELKQRLFAERDKIFEERPGLRFFGKDYIFPTTISLLCTQACYLQTANDITLYGIKQPIIRDRLFNVIISLVADAPPPKRSRRK